MTYNELAAVIAKMPVTHRKFTAQFFCLEFAAKYPAFEPDKWMKACVGSSEGFEAPAQFASLAGRSTR